MYIPAPRPAKMDRSRRASNPENFSVDGMVKPGPKKWVRSERYKRRQRRFAEAERRLAATRKASHGRLANRLLTQGNVIKTEKLSYRSFQKNYGRSVKVRAPGMLVEIVRRKAEGAGGGLVEINTRSTRLSQFDHTTGEYAKKPLSQRVHVFGDGVTEPVQRDLYSAFLATCCDTDTLDIRRVLEAWPTAEPLLRRAMSKVDQPASGKDLVQPRVHCLRISRSLSETSGGLLPPEGGVRAGRPSKVAGRPAEGADAVAKARAAQRSDNGAIRTPAL